MHKNLHKSETYSYTIDYVYNGDNITSEKWIYEDATDFTTYTYDDKLSPYYNLINYAESPATSKNNILTMKQQFHMMERVTNLPELLPMNTTENGQ